LTDFAGVSKEDEREGRKVEVRSRKGRSEFRVGSSASLTLTAHVTSIGSAGATHARTHHLHDYRSRQLAEAFAKVVTLHSKAPAIGSLRSLRWRSDSEVATTVQSRATGNLQVYSMTVATRSRLVMIERH
jgi:hypothetical protein